MDIEDIKGPVLFSWEAYEFKDRDLKTDWYWALGIIAIAGSVAAFLFGNFLFGVFIIFAGIAVGFFSRIKPQLITYEITEFGVMYEGTFYPYENLEAFWMNELEPDNKKLLIKSNRLIVPILTLPYNTEDEGDAIFEVLSEFLPDSPLREPFGHTIMDRLGF